MVMVVVRLEQGIEGDPINVNARRNGKAVYTWYVRALNPEANRAVAELLRDKEEENLCRGIKCADYRSRELWLMDSYDTIIHLQNSRSQFQLKFEIWFKHGEDGLPKLFRSNRHKAINIGLLVQQGIPVHTKPKCKGEPKSGRSDSRQFAGTKSKQPLKVR